MKRVLTFIVTGIIALLFVVNTAATDNSALVENPVFDTEYYNQLNDNARQVYDLLLDNIDVMKDGVSEISGNVGPISISKQAVMSSAFSAARMDDMMLYFIDVTKLSVLFKSYGTGETTVSIGLDRNERNYYRGDYSGKEELEAELASVNRVINSIVSEAEKKNSDYEKLKYVHDWLVTNNTYNSHVINGNTDQAPDSAWSLVSALLSNNDPSGGPVCEGYSKAFAACARRLGFECILVPGDVISNGNRGGHMWNYVKLDGKWYAVDVTWDDPVTDKPINPVKTTYFLCGSNTVISADNTFSDNHKPGTGSYMFADFALPALATDAYQNVPGKAVTACTASAATVTYGEQTAINVKITASTAVSSGKISVYNKTELIGSTTVSNGAATVRAGLAAGNYNLTVKYEGTDGFEPSSASVNCSVNKKMLTVRLEKASVDNKTFDGSSSAKVNISPVFVGAVGNDNPIPVTGYFVSAKFADAEPGKNKKVTLNITGIRTADNNYTCAENFTATLYGNILPSPETQPEVTEPEVTEPPVTQPVTEKPETQPNVTEPFMPATGVMSTATDETDVTDKSGNGTDASTSSPGENDSTDKETTADTEDEALAVFGSTAKNSALKKVILIVATIILIAITVTVAVAAVKKR